MISFARPLPIGNAVSLLLAPASGAVAWRLLRKATGTFTGQDDPDALVIYAGSDTTDFIDTTSLTNGTPYYYAAFDYIDDAWVASAVITATPQTSYGLGGPDPLSLVRDRVELGLRAAVGQGVLKHDSGYIPTLTAPPLYENTLWPVVSVHVQNDSPSVRGIGELVQSDIKDAVSGTWTESDGWVSQWRIQIIGWSLNPDERITLRKTLKNVVLGNLPVFDSVGMVEPSLTQTDVEDFESYGAPVYQVICELSFLAPSTITSTDPSIADVTVDAEST